MKTEVGLWIDHRKAIIVTVTAKGEETKQIKSTLEKHVRYSGGSRQDGSQEAEDVRDRGFTNQLGKYYDDVIACIRDAEFIQIFGPGEAKNELEKRLKSTEHRGRIVRIETADKMTTRQIAAKVRHYFSVDT